jgi:hypothetical protein
MTNELLGNISGEIQKAEGCLRNALKPLTEALGNPFFDKPCAEVLHAHQQATEALDRVQDAQHALETLAKRTALRGDEKRLLVDHTPERIVVTSPLLTDGRPVIVAETEDVPALDEVIA